MDALPVIIVWAPRIIAFVPDAQTLFYCGAYRGLWKAGAQSTLTSWVLANAGKSSITRGVTFSIGLLRRQDVAEENFLDSIWPDLGHTLECSYMVVSKCWACIVTRSEYLGLHVPLAVVQ